jgi:hypothetical protein
MSGGDKMDTYVRVDQIDRYIYFLNDTPLYCNYKGELIYRSQYLLRSKGRFPCIRMKQLKKMPLDKKTNKWYNKNVKREGRSESLLQETVRWEPPKFEKKLCQTS